MQHMAGQKRSSATKMAIKPGTSWSHADQTITWMTRVLYLSVFSTAVFFYTSVQTQVDQFYSYIQTTWFFRSVYFETWWVSICYPLVQLVPFLMNKVRLFDRYKLDSKVTWKDTGMITNALEVVEYCTPLMILDTVLMKKYTGVQQQEWHVRRSTWIQTTRALPPEGPAVYRIATDIILAIFVFDIFFYGLHLLMHKKTFLYKHVHSWHHEHDVIFSRITNKLSLAERYVLILSANYSLKVLGAHPLTRAIFVPFFLIGLVENHCGYDMPWAIDKVVPFGILGGSARHHQHHQINSPDYQPFFTYIDDFMNKKKQV